MQKGLVLLAAALAVVLMAQHAEAGDPIWDISVDNRTPFIGDPVTFYVDSVYRGEYVVLLAEVVNTTGQRVAVDIIRIDELGLANWTWRTSLDMAAGNYLVMFSYKGQRVASISVELVYDELDWLTKYSFELEQRIREQNERILETAMIATDAREGVWEYISGPGVVVLVTSLVNIALVLTVGLRYYADATYGRLRRGVGRMSWFEHSMAPQTDGNFSRMSGYEDVNEPDRDLTDEEFIRRSREYVRSPIRRPRRS